ncbi:hypothetical protein [Stieleria magnilauensis]|uniref:hypothetical protein n=1 Tax=Stieleria magnilauensis TaxID=2527963 RepID=UPI003AF67E5C
MDCDRDNRQFRGSRRGHDCLDQAMQNGNDRVFVDRVVGDWGRRSNRWKAVVC